MTPDWTRYQAVVGKRWDHYEPRFERFARGAWLSWNWAAFFATLAWLRYRKLYAWSWLYFFVSAPVLFVVYAAASVASDSCARALAPGSGELGTYLLALLGALGWVLPPLFADRFYFQHVRTLAQGDLDPPGARAGTGGVLGALALQASVVILASVGLPSFGSYEYRSRVTEGLNAAGVLKAPVEEYLQKFGRLPARIEEVAGVTSTKMVREVTLVRDGTLRATFGAAGERLEGRSVHFVPRLEAGKVVAWTCGSKDLPDQCLPASCRKR